MNSLNYKNTIQKIIIILVCIILLNFITPTVSVQAGWGGTLLTPAVQSTNAFFDTISFIMESLTTGANGNFIIRPQDVPDGLRFSGEPDIIIDGKDFSNTEIEELVSNATSIVGFGAARIFV